MGGVGVVLRAAHGCAVCGIIPTFSILCLYDVFYNCRVSFIGMRWVLWVWNGLCWCGMNFVV